MMSPFENRYTLYFFLLLFLGAKVFAISHGSWDGHHGHNHHVHKPRDSKDNPSHSAISSVVSASVSSPSPQTSVMSLSEANAIVNDALKAAAALNKGRLNNPQRNTYSFRNGAADGMYVPAPPLNSSATAMNGKSDLLKLSNGTNATADFAYTIPPNIAEAARIVAEATSHEASGDIGIDIAQILGKYRTKKNDTNAPRQAYVAPTGVEGFIPSNAQLPLVAVNGTNSQIVEKRSDADFWLTEIAQNGYSPYAPAGYKVWRNVRDYGAKGDGVTDDTAAINAAISDGGRCGVTCGSSSVYPAFVYFPSGTYLVSSPIIQYYNTELYGNPLSYPTILAAPSFVGLGVITSDVYTGATSEWYVDTNNFLRSIRNFVMDITRTDPSAYVCAIHWQVAQATSLENIIFHMMQDDTTTQQGIYMENGSGGFLTNLTFVGGNFGAYFGNQQFTTTQLSFLNCNTAVQIDWDWAWTMQDIVILNCNRGVVIVGGAGGPMSTGQSVGSLVLVDTFIANTPIGIETSLFSVNSTAFLIQNGAFVNVSTAVYDNVKSATLVEGGVFVTVDSWGFGLLATSSTNSTFIDGQEIPAMRRSAELTGSDAYFKLNFFERRRPTYADVGMSQIIDVKAWGAAGDGKTDDTAVLNSILDRAANMASVVFFPYGIYMVSNTLHVPVGSRIIGQTWAQIMATGPNFANEKAPRVVVQVGDPGDVGIIEIQSMMFTVSGATAGAVLMEWNVHESTQGSAGIWDSHFRVGGAAGSNLQASDCPIDTIVNTNCKAASLHLHLTPQSSAYMENIWIWTADHDMDIPAQTQINVYSGRGLLIESQGPTWMYGTASEHHVMYQYQVSQAQNLYMAMIQTESPYYQPSPAAPAPFTAGLFPNDPTFLDCDTGSSSDCAVSWALRIIDSTIIYSMGAGLYSWFSDYDQTCLSTEDCQRRAVYISQSTDTWLYNLVTKGIVEMVSPVNENATLSASNINGFMASILAWVRENNNTIGAEQFPGFQIYDLTDLDGLTATCATALTQTIHCSYYFLSYQSPRVGISLQNATLTDEICASSCGASLEQWFENVASNCANETIGDTNPTLIGGYIWEGYNQTCLKDPSSGQYCTDVIDDFGTASSMTSLPQSQLCSWCYTNMFQTWQSSPYSVYNEMYEEAYVYIANECGLDVSTDILPAIVIPPTQPTAICLSDIKYVIQSGDTCDSIAMAYNVTSATILSGNPNSVFNCSGLIPENEICMPLTCGPLYEIQDEDTCSSIESSYGLSLNSLRQYNPWITFGCDNLQEAREILGSIICLGPQAGEFTNTTNTIPGASSSPSTGTGYSLVVMPPPDNSTVADGTTTYCGTWYTAAANDTCAAICVQQSIPSALFVQCNPSLSSVDCDSSLVLGTTYCVSPNYAWNDTAFWNVDNTSSISNQAFKDDFSSGSMAQWMIYDGSFDASSGALVGSNSFGGKALINSNYGNFLYEVDVTLPSASGNAGLVFRVTNPSVGADAYNGYYAGISTSGVFVGRASNSWTPLSSAQVNLAINQSHHVKVEVVDTTLNIFVDDMNKVLVSVTDGTYTSGMNGVRVYGTEAIFDNIQINPLIFRDDFSSGTMGKWTTIDGQYQVSSNIAVLTASPAAKAVTTGVTSKDIIYKADISINSTPNGNGGMIFRVSNAAPGADTYNGYYVGIGIGYVVFGFADTNWNEIKRVDAADIIAGQMYHLMVQTSGDSISIFVDDLNTPRTVVKDDKYSAGLSGLRAYTTTMSVSNVRIYAA